MCDPYCEDVDPEDQMMDQEFEVIDDGVTNDDDYEPWYQEEETDEYM